MAAIVGGAAALGGLVATLKIGIDQFMGAQKVLAQTGAVLKSTGGAANVTSKRITAMSESLMKLSGVDDEAIQSGQNLLLTFTKIRNETGKGNNIFDQATLAMTNLSVAMGKDLSSSAILVGKALNDPVKGVGALSRAGVQFTASQKDTIKSLVDSGNVMGAQKLILKELETQFGGSAKAAGQTLTGQLNILRETFNNVAGDLVAIFIPFVSRAATGLLNFVRQFAARPTFEGKVRFIVEKIRDAAGNTFTSLYDWWTKSKTSVNTTGTITFTLAGKEQFDKFFTGLEGSARQAGRDLVNALASTVTSEGRQRVGSAIVNMLGTVTEVLAFTFRISGTTLALNLIAGIIEGLFGLIGRVKAKLEKDLRTTIETLNPFSPVEHGGVIIATKLIDGIVSGLENNKGKVKRKITDTVREAVTAARQGLAGLGSTLGGLLSEITGTSSPEAKQAAAIRAQQKTEAAAREKTRLESALATAQTADERTQAQQDLNDFLLEQEATRLEDSVAQQQSANQRAIDDLIAEFNRGKMSADTFRAKLDTIIGGASGKDLGMAFADGFTSGFQDIINAVKDLAGVQKKVGGREIKPVAGTPAAEAARAAHKQWRDDRDAYRAKLMDAAKADGSDSDETITDAERASIKGKMVAWGKKNKEPVRMAAGGILKRQVFTAGEAGREAVIPLGSSEAMGIMRDALGGGGGGTTYNLVINAGLGTNPDELGRTIVESIKKFEKRNGQVFAGPQIQATSAGVSTNGGTQTRSIRRG
jgi:hypothetical protein